MSDLAHVRLVFAIPGPKSMSFGMDWALGSGDWDATLLLDIASTTFTAWGTGGTKLAQKFPNDVILTKVTAFAYDVVANPTPGPGESPFIKQLTLGPQEATGNSPGGSVVAPLPPQCALVISFKTAVSTRRTRGRAYLPPLPNNFIDERGVLTSGQPAAIEGLFQDFVDEIEAGAPVGSPWGHKVVSLQEAALATDVTDYICRNRIDTQRRRLSRALDTTV